MMVDSDDSDDSEVCFFGHGGVNCSAAVERRPRSRAVVSAASFAIDGTDADVRSQCPVSSASVPSTFAVVNCSMSN